MKKLKLLFLVPALFAMTACGLGSEVTKEKAQEYAEEMKKQDEPENVTFNLKMSGTSGKEKAKMEMEYKIKTSKDAGSYYYVSMEEDGEKSLFEVYQVPNDKYEEVTWVKYLEEGKEQTLCYGKKDNAEYSIVTRYVMNAGMAPAMMYAMFSSPDIAAAEYEENEDYKVQYFSNGAKNLSVKVTFSETKASDEEEYMTSGSLTITYDNYLLKSIDESATSNIGNKVSVKGNASYDAVKLSLPSGWEDIINKEQLHKQKLNKIARPRAQLFYAYRFIIF